MSTLKCCKKETIGRVDPEIVRRAVEEIRERTNPDTPIQASDLKDAARQCDHSLHTLVGWGWFQDKRMAENARDAFARQLMTYHVIYRPPTVVPPSRVTVTTKKAEPVGRVPIAMGHHGVGYAEASPSLFLERAVSGNPSCRTLLKVYGDWLPDDAVKHLKDAQAAIQREVERLRAAEAA